MIHRSLSKINRKLHTEHKPRLTLQTQQVISATQVKHLTALQLYTINLNAITAIHNSSERHYSYTQHISATHNTSQLHTTHLISATHNTSQLYTKHLISATHNTPRLLSTHLKPLQTHTTYLISATHTSHSNFKHKSNLSDTRT